ncbi:MAG TPA: PP2C family protein-serine/threonine phosphatase [Candidatus Acidoferrum sp.]|nr:PP2C family protein-serine/threonine phosphatase [Candidatus Acidoferrum sp.]
MSAPVPTSPGTSRPRPAPIERVQNFWQRVSEGRAVEDLWSQFAADARSSYGFYGQDVDWDEIHKLPRWKQPWPVIKQFFWALLNKLTPARRVLLLAALVLLFLSGIQFQVNNQSATLKFEFLAAVLLLLLLSLELADKVTMKRDLEIAREIQSWLVPSEPPAIPGAEVAFWTRPQNSVAGDYYDAFYPTADAASGGKLLLVMADVAGKSVPAALLMATLQASLRTLASEGLPVMQLAERLNHYACAHSLEGLRFTTAVIGEYDPSTRHLVYVNAGHNSPVVRRTNGGIERLESGGLPFGILREATFVAASVDLQPGDTLVLFTDGVVEAFNSAGEEFTDARWLQLIRDLPNLPAQATMQYLMQQVGQFVGATRQSDDITCLVLRCK